MNDRRTASGSLPTYFLFAFLFSWFFWGWGVAATAGWVAFPFPNLVWAAIGAHGPLAAALVLTGRAQGWAGIKDLLRRGLNPRLAWKWWLAAFLIPAGLGGLAVWFHFLLNGARPDLSLLSQPVMILPTLVFMFFLGGSVQEEFGWRGYALPRLLEKWNPLVSSLILGFIWGCWHLPLFYMSGVSQAYMSFAVFLPLVIAFSFLITWAYLGAGRNLFAALLFHTTINTFLSVFPPIELRPGGDQTAMLYLMGLYVLVALALVTARPRLWFRPPPE